MTQYYHQKYRSNSAKVKRGKEKRTDDKERIKDKEQRR
jgi:hypothetical protein